MNKMMNEPGALYRGTSSELYLVTGMTANMCTARIDHYAAYRNIYTPAFIQDLRTSAEEAEALPDYSARQATSTTLRNARSAANTSFCGVFAAFIGYIKRSFEPAVVEGMKKKAGNDLYMAALGEKWSATTAMIAQGTAFIDTYSAELTAGGMPEDFPDRFATSGDTFKTALTAFTGYKEEAATGTAAKMAANNDLYIRTQEILQDGKIVFAGEPAMKKQYSYTALLKKVKGTGRSGFRIALKAAGVLTPISTASIAFMPTGKSFVADTKGIIKDALPEGVYSYTLTAPGFQTVYGTLEISIGVVRHKKIEMTSAALMEATA